MVTGLLTGRIIASGLLSRKRGPNSEGASPERVQLLLTTIAAAGMYLSRVLVASDHAALPEIDNMWIAATGGSNVIYIIGKGLTAWRNRERMGQTS